MNDPVTAANAKPRPLPRAMVAALRPRQWIKNVLVAAVPLAAGALFVPDIAFKTAVAFVAFCLAASATYLVNDSVDVTEDRLHPTKRFRPIAAGELPIPFALALAAALFGGSIAVSFVASWQLAMTVVAYVVVTLAYSLKLKHEPVVELAILTLGFLLRAAAGATATGLEVSQWFLIVAGFGSLFMAAGKRYSELRRSDTDGLADSPTTRHSLHGYTGSYLRFVWSISAAVVITSYSLWAFDVHSSTEGGPWVLWSIFPFVFAILRYAADVDAARAEAPEDVVLSDKILAAIGALWLVLFAIGVFYG